MQDIYIFSSIFGGIYGVIFSLIELEIVRIIYIVDDKAKNTFVIGQSMSTFLVSILLVTPILGNQIVYNNENASDVDDILYYISVCIVGLLSLCLLISGLCASCKFYKLRQTVFEKSLLEQDDNDSQFDETDFYPQTSGMNSTLSPVSINS